jgi:ATP-dependent Clp protease ATP-binding subunit ClpA
MGSLGFLGEKEQKQKNSLKEKVMESLKENFRPEFLNRIDEIIIFNYLGEDEIKKIVDLELEKVVERLASQKIKVRITEEAKKLLAELGFDPNLGARPLKRVIQKEVLNPLALKIVSGIVKENDEVEIGRKDKKIVIMTEVDFTKSNKKEKAKKE